MLGREYSQWNGDEDTAQGDELIPAASRADLFSKYKNSGDKIEKPGIRTSCAKVLRQRLHPGRRVLREEMGEDLRFQGLENAALLNATLREHYLFSTTFSASPTFTAAKHAYAGS
jgi:hypothetical protein